MRGWDRFWLTVGVVALVAVSAVGLALSEVSDVVTGRRRRDRRYRLDRTHRADNGDRLPVGDINRIKQEWSL